MKNIIVALFSIMYRKNNYFSVIPLEARTTFSLFIIPSMKYFRFTLASLSGWRAYGILALLLFFLSANVQAQAPYVTGVAPTQNALNILTTTALSATFSQDINSSTCTNSTIKINGSLSGLHTATFNYNSSNKTITITPTVPFKVGEVVTATLTRGIKSSLGDSLAAAMTWRFVTNSNSHSSGQFVQSSTPSVGASPCFINAGDFNGDGFIDLVTANSGSASVSILLNNGSGIFTQTSTPAVGNLPHSIAVGDFNSDGSLDLAVPNYFSNNVSILMNNGSGTFTLSSSPNVGSNPRSITTGDFNGDGYLDLAVANWSSNNVSILMNNGDGTFTLSATPSVGVWPWCVTTGEIGRAHV
jgi:hypothetical protein